MNMNNRGCGIIFFNQQRDSVLVFLRDNKSWIPFPNTLDLLGGHVEDGESPEEAIVREMSEELFDLRTGLAYVLEQHKLLLIYADERKCEQSIFVRNEDFEIVDLRLLEGKELVWVSRQEIEDGLKMAFEFDDVLRQFFTTHPKLKP